MHVRRSQIDFTMCRNRTCGSAIVSSIRSRMQSRSLAPEWSKLAFVGSAKTERFLSHGLMYDKQCSFTVVSAFVSVLHTSDTKSRVR
jgi:hypothetical protein